MVFIKWNRFKVLLHKQVQPCRGYVASASQSGNGGNDFKYSDIASNFEWKVPEFWNFAYDVIDRHASNPVQGEKVAFNFVPEDPADDVTTWTYKDLSQVSKLYAQALHSNLGPIKRAIIILPKIPEWWVLNISALRIGTVLLPGTSMLTETDINHRLSKSNSDCIIVNEELASHVEHTASKHKHLKHKIFVRNEDRYSDAARVGNLLQKGWISLHTLVDSVHPYDTEDLPTLKTRSSDVMQIFFTSGTTGSPKMVGHTHGSYGYCHKVTGKYWLDLTADDLHWNIADTGWAKSAWSNVFAPWIQGAGVFVHGMNRFLPEDVAEILSRHPVTTLCAPPTLYRSMVMLARDEIVRHRPAKLRHCVSAGEPLNEEVIRIWKDLTGIWIKEGYGQTETTLVAGTFKGMEVKPGSMGKPAPGYDVRIIDDEGFEVKQGQQGIIAIKNDLEGYNRHPGLFSGYIGDNEKTSQSFFKNFYLTGDRGFVDKDGYIWFSARADDVIISSGYRIGPFEVESILLEHEAIVESAVVASPDEERGHVVKAFVVLTKEFQKEVDELLIEEERLVHDIQQFVKIKTAPYKYPRKIEFVRYLPKTVSGKIRRTVLREREEIAYNNNKMKKELITDK